MFMHIPLREVKVAYDEYVNNGRQNTENVEFVSGNDGESDEIVFCSRTDENLFETVKELGSTKDIIDVAQIAKKNGVNILVITCYDRSPLAKYADHILLSTRREAAYEGGSVSTIVSISYIIGVLYSAIYERLGKKADEYTLRAAKSVANKSM